MQSDPLQANAKAILKLAALRGLHIATAESCTAGALAKLLAETPGAGGTLLGSFVCYDKAFKVRLLRVPISLVQSETAVSRRVAEAMAQGTLEVCEADVALALTGVAGPDPDEDGNPVGLVHIALVGSNGQRAHVRLDLGQDETKTIKLRAVAEALQLTLAALENWQPMPEAPKNAKAF